MRWSLLLLAACAPKLTTHRVGTLTISAASSADVKQTEAALVSASKEIDRVGGLRFPVRVSVLGSHVELENAVGRTGHTWLRAWSRFDEVLLQSPSTWATTEAELTTLFVHELAHCLMFQRSAKREDWRDKKVPFWFREGFALHVAKQGSTVPSLEDVSAFVLDNPTLNLLADAEKLSQAHFGPTYGMAFYAFTFLQRRYGADAPLRVMTAMAEGATFAVAFERTLTLEPVAFERDVATFIRLRAFRHGSRLKLERIEMPALPH
jgi:hypothetical protein